MNLVSRAPFNGPFGSDVVVGAVVGLRGIFDASYSDPLGIASTTPVLMLPTEDCVSAAVVHGLAVTVYMVSKDVPASAQNFTVAGQPEHDGTGVSVLRLHKAS